MLQELTYSGVTIDIDINMLKQEFKKQYADRFQLDSIEIITDNTYFPGADSIISGRAFALHASCSLRGLAIHTVDFGRRQVYFTLSPFHFDCIKEALRCEYLQQRSAEKTFLKNRKP